MSTRKESKREKQKRERHPAVPVYRMRQVRGPEPVVVVPESAVAKKPKVVKKKKKKKKRKTILNGR